jgi:hypothetical protein
VIYREAELSDSICFSNRESMFPVVSSWFDSNLTGELELLSMTLEGSGLLILMSIEVSDLPSTNLCFPAFKSNSLR